MEDVEGTSALMPLQEGMATCETAEIVDESIILPDDIVRCLTSLGVSLREDLRREVSLSVQHASEEMRGNWEVLLAAVRQDGSALEYASE